MQRFYSPQLDGLRFVAALAVFIHHSPAIPGLGWIRELGWAGVDLFLCISSFLITKLILIERETSGRFSLKSFYVRRALRIWPLYFGFVTAMLVLTLALRTIPVGDALGWWISHFTFSANVLTAINGYEGQLIFTSHLWTISLEEQAYLVLPIVLVLYFCSRREPRRVAHVAIALLLSLAVLRALCLWGETPHPFVWVLPLRADAFVMGAVAALLAIKPRAWMAPAGLALVASAGLFPPVDQPSLFTVIGYPLVDLGCVLIVIGAQGINWASGPLASRPLRFLGKISFGIYVFHVAAIDLVLGRVNDFGLPALIVGPLALALTVALAAASYAWYERPFLVLKQRFERVSSRPV